MISAHIERELNSALVTYSESDCTINLENINGCVRLFRREVLSEVAAYQWFAILSIPIDCSIESILSLRKEFHHHVAFGFKIKNGYCPSKYTAVLKLNNKYTDEEFQKNRHLLSSIKLENLMLKVVALHTVTFDEDFRNCFPRIDLVYQHSVDEYQCEEQSDEGKSDTTKKKIFTELSACPACLDRFNSTILGISYQKNLDELCSLSTLEDSYCRICYYIREGRMGTRWGQNIKCSACDITHNLWICMLCGHIGCGRYTSEHAKVHHSVTGHSYCIQFSTGRIWDYSGDQYVQRIVQDYDLNLNDLSFATSRRLEVNGKLHDFVEDEEVSKEFSSSSIKEVQQKCHIVAQEYETLLANQLDEQQNYYEELISRIIADKTQQHFDPGSSGTENDKEYLTLKKEVEELKAQCDAKMDELRDLQEIQREKNEKNAKLIESQCEMKKEIAKLKQEAADERAAGKEMIDALEQQIASLSFHIRTQAEIMTKAEIHGGQLIVDNTESGAQPLSLREKLQKKLHEKQRQRRRSFR